MNIRLGFFIFAALHFSPTAQGIVFSGSPSVKVSEAGIDRTPEIVSQKESKSLRCAIREDGGNYYWVTRGDVEMARIVSGAFITYIALNGTGYVRLIKPTFKEIASLMSPTEEKYDYVEHMLLGLRSVTYFGTED